MRKRIPTLLLTAVLAVSAVAGATGVASAKHGADDPVGHVRHSGDDDATTTQSTHRARHRHGRHGDRHDRRDDHRAGHQRHGADDGPNHS